MRRPCVLHCWCLSRSRRSNSSCRAVPSQSPQRLSSSNWPRYPVTRRLVLDALKPEYALRMVCRSLGVSGLPPEVERVIEERAAGNPLFSEQLAYALRDNGLIAISEGQCRITESVPGASLDAALTGMRFPSTVEGVITSRLDRMTPGEQLTVKIASVIGQSFGLELLTQPLSGRGLPLRPSQPSGPA